MKTITSLRINTELLTELKVLAAKDNRTLTNYIENVLFNHIKGSENTAQTEEITFKKEPHDSWQSAEDLIKFYNLPFSATQVKYKLKQAGIQYTDDNERGRVFNITETDVKILLK